MAIDPSPQPVSAADRRARLERIFRAINRGPDYLAGTGAIAMLVFVLLQIVSRWIGRPVAWTEEGTRFVFVWIVFLGVAAGFRKVESARITVFLSWLPRSVRRLAPHVFVVCSAGFFLLILWTGADVVLQQVRTHEMGSALMIPMWLVGLCVPVSALLGISGIVESVLLHRERLQPEEE